MKKNSKQITKLISMSLVGVLALSLSACGAAKPKDDPTAPIVIGGIGPLTGDASQYGIATMNGAQMAFAEAETVLGRKIEFKTMDDKNNIEEATNAYNKLFNNDKVVAIIGGVTSGPSAAIAAKSQKDGIPIISPTGTHESVTLGSLNVFRACFVDAFQGKVMANFTTKSLKLNTAAVLYNNTLDYSTGLYKSFEETLIANGGQVLVVESYGQGDSDFNSQLTKIAATNPDVLFLPDYYDNVALITKQAKEMGITSIFLGADGWDGVLEKVSDTSFVEGAFFCNHYSADDPDPKIQNFIKAYKTKYEMEPNAFAALGYDAANIMLAAMEKAGTTDKDAVIKALNETDFDGVTSKITFDAERNPVKKAAILEISGGKVSLYETLLP